MPYIYIKGEILYLNNYIYKSRKNFFCAKWTHALTHAMALHKYFFLRYCAYCAKVSANMRPCAKKITILRLIWRVSRGWIMDVHSAPSKSTLKKCVLPRVRPPWTRSTVVAKKEQQKRAKKFFCPTNGFLQCQQDQHDQQQQHHHQQQQQKWFNAINITVVRHQHKCCVASTKLWCGIDITVMWHGLV